MRLQARTITTLALTGLGFAANANAQLVAYGPRADLYGSTGGTGWTGP